MSEFRQDPVSKDWILISPERSRRPSEFAKDRKKRTPSPRSHCPFEPEKLSQAPNWPPILSTPHVRNWRVVVVPNRFPALTHVEKCSEELDGGPYRSRTGIGHHDLIITRHHEKNFASLSLDRALEVLDILKRRYLQLVEDSCILYTSSFFNWGPKAGASVFHPHYQILSLPIIPPDIQHSLNGSERYYAKHQKCIHCEMIAYEKKNGSRVIAENKQAIVLAPYVSRRPFEVRLFPKMHTPFFEQSSGVLLTGVTELLQKSLRVIKKKLNDPDLNFFIHTSPLKRQEEYTYYHWHIEIFPHISTPAGFELSTGVEINSVDPNFVATTLRYSL